MFSKKIIMLLTVIFILLSCVTFVSASQDNITADEIISMESSFGEEIIADDLDDEIQSLDDNVELTSDEGEFIDVNDAYVYLNEFRTSDGVWQWNDDDTTKTYFNTNDTNKLQPLARDLDLEETAKIRAKELVESFSHTRPNGTDCFTAFPSDLWALGENIAYGQTSAKAVTVAWEENDDLYSGQGHRRNMLNSDFNCVGIAGYKLNGVIYWVQDFGNRDNINQGEINYSGSNVANTSGSSSNNNVASTSSNTKTDVSKKSVKLTAKSVTFKVKKSKKYSVTLKSGKNPVKKVKVTLKIKGKTYKATTNSKGKATFKIKLTKKGTYKSTVTFTGDKSYNKVSKSIKIYVK